MKFHCLFTTILAVSIFITVPILAHACPKVGAIVDYNCDRSLSVVVIGDSLVYGIGDTANNDQGGYVLRASKTQRSITFSNLGIPGYKATTLISDLNGKATTNRAKRILAAIKSADVVVLDVGRNDRWFFGEPKATYNILKRSVKRIEKIGSDTNGVAPAVVTAVLMLPNRGSQGPWVSELNDLILTNRKYGQLRFDQVSKRLLAEDQIHPTSQGYSALEKVFVDYIKGPLAKKLARLRPDKDKDGIYDIFESLRFGTDPTLVDSDGNGVKDGKQIFP